MILVDNLTETILETAKDLTRPMDYPRLLEEIINDAMRITNSDGGTLYIMINNALYFMIMITKSKDFRRGGDGKPVDLPPVELDSTSVCAYVARTKTTKNIADVYHDKEFNWDGPKKYDKLNDYHTCSELVVPLINHEQKVIGVLQLINAHDGDGNIVAYTEQEEQICEAIGSLAAVSLSNSNMIKQLQELLDSIALSFTDAIETRTPFNANHTRHVAQYCWDFAEFLNKRAQEEGKTNPTLDENSCDQLYMAASLHDIGKMSVSRSLLNKADRLGPYMDRMKERWRFILTDLRVKKYAGTVTDDEYVRTARRYNEYIDFIMRINTAGYLDDETLEKVEEIAAERYWTFDGEEIMFVSEPEAEDLRVRKGTLTTEERKAIEKHAEYTSKILEKITFGDKYNRVRFIAGAHHEYLDGSGYPEGLTADKLPIEVRILTIMDIFDSLTADDRPYKKAHDKEGALRILSAMVTEGKLDPELVELAKEFFETEPILDR
jgi:HD-GYP domain-containing protein (c-di-GMP phosphodiesterase class II)